MRRGGGRMLYGLAVEGAGRRPSCRQQLSNSRERTLLLQCHLLPNCLSRPLSLPHYNPLRKSVASDLPRVSVLPSSVLQLFLVAEQGKEVLLFTSSSSYDGYQLIAKSCHSGATVSTLFPFRKKLLKRLTPLIQFQAAYFDVCGQCFIAIQLYNILISQVQIGIFHLWSIWISHFQRYR